MAEGLSLVVALALVLLSLVLILIGLALLRYGKLKRMRNNGLEQFILCDGREQWGTGDLVSRWRSQAILHIASELSKIQHEIWQIRHKIENLLEMRIGLGKKQEELDLSLTIAKKRNAPDLIRFIRFEIKESKSKLADISRRIQQNERKLKVLKWIMIEKKECINAYREGKNPKGALIRRIRRRFSHGK
jgi:flagellar biosynthesis chaperone FliJ